MSANRRYANAGSFSPNRLPPREAQHEGHPAVRFYFRFFGFFRLHSASRAAKLIRVRPECSSFAEARAVETDPSLLLALIAIRMLGGQSVPAASPILKAFKEAIQAAKEKKWQGAIQEISATA
jgi:hypothetical protein